MADRPPPPITPAERQARLRWVTSIARRLGFVGRVDYRHVRTTTGGAQYGMGTTASRDLLVVYAEAFERDANPDDFSLEAILAHERGHQVVCRNARLQRFLAGRSGGPVDELLASLVGSLLAEAPTNQQALVLKALAEAVQCGVPLTDAERLVTELRDLVERSL